MSCSFPIKMKKVGDEYSGFRYVPLSLSDDFNPDRGDIKVPCKKCAGCRLDYSRSWADRLMLELDHSGKAIFLTLTYDDDHVHFGDFDACTFTLEKTDWVLFMKRLREKFSDFPLRFYMCGEYGDHSFRPHYHAIIFGLSPSDIPDLIYLKSNRFKQSIYTSPLIARLWRNGFISIANVSWQCCAYVARYTLKKRFGVDADFYATRNVLPEFSLMSRRPGISGYFFDDHPDLVGFSQLPISDPFGLHQVKSVILPKYLLNQLEISNPEVYTTLCAQRKTFSLARDELVGTDLLEDQYNALKEADLVSKISWFTRDV